MSSQGNFRFGLITSLLCCFLVCGVVLGQTFSSVFITYPIGNEQVEVSNQGSMRAQVYLSQLRDARGYEVNATIPASYVVRNGTSIVDLTNSGAIASGTITLPVSPVDGQTMRLFSVGGVTTLTLSASAGMTVNNAVTALTALTAVEYLFNRATLAWNRIM